MTYSDAIAARLDRLLVRLGELVDADPARNLLAKPDDWPGPMGDEHRLDWWPVGLPHPLTARAALDLMRDNRELLADLVAGDIAATVAAMVEPDVQAAVLSSPRLVAEWRWPWVDMIAGNGSEWYGPTYVSRLALGRLMRNWAGELDPADVGRWPDGELTHRTVAEWAREPLNRQEPTTSDELLPFAKMIGLSPEYATTHKAGINKRSSGDALLADVDRYNEIQRVPLLRRADGWPVELHRTTLALLYLVERDALAALPGKLAAAAWLTVRSWARAAPGDVHNAAATTALDREAAPTEAVPLLARELWAMCPGLVAKVAPNPDPPVLDPQAVPERDGMLTLDADLADWLATIDQGDADKAQASARERLARYKAGELDARQLFARWTNGSALAAVAVVLWRVRVATQWERQQNQHPAATSGVLDLLLAASYGTQWELPLVGLAPASLKDKRGRILADFSAAGLDADTLTQMFRGRSLLATVAGTRLVRWELVTAHKQWLEMYGTGGDFSRTVIDGGWTGLAAAVGEHNPAMVANLRDMVKAQAHGVFSLPGGRKGNLLIYDEGPRAARGRSATLILKWSDALLPGYVHSLPPGKAGESHRRDRVLVPVLDSLPDLGSTGYYAGAAAMLHWLVMLDMAQGAPELQRYGGVYLNWPKLWADAGLPAEHGRKLRDRWTADGDNAPAFLRDIGGGRYALGTAHEKAQAFILARNDLPAAKAKKHAPRKRG